MVKMPKLTTDEQIIVDELPRETFLYICDRDADGPVICNGSNEPSPTDELGIYGVYKLVEVRQVIQSVKTRRLSVVRA
jgi:hypothetical protein